MDTIKIDGIEYNLVPKVESLLKYAQNDLRVALLDNKKPFYIGDCNTRLIELEVDGDVITNANVISFENTTGDDILIPKGLRAGIIDTTGEVLYSARICLGIEVICPEEILKFKAGSITLEDS